MYLIIKNNSQSKVKRLENFLSMPINYRKESKLNSVFVFVVVTSVLISSSESKFGLSTSPEQNLVSENPPSPPVASSGHEETNSFLQNDLGNIVFGIPFQEEDQGNNVVVVDNDKSIVHSFELQELPESPQLTREEYQESIKGIHNILFKPQEADEDISRGGPQRVNFTRCNDGELLPIILPKQF